MSETPGDARAGTARGLPLPLRAVWHTIYWTHERATWQYDLMVAAILAFVWLTPPDWLADPTARGVGPVGWLWRLIAG